MNRLLRTTTTTLRQSRNLKQFQNVKKFETLYSWNNKALLLTQQQQVPPPPKGWENFYPRNKKSSEQPSSSSTSGGGDPKKGEEEKKKNNEQNNNTHKTEDNNNSKNDFKFGGSGGNNNNKGPNIPNNQTPVWASLGLLALFLMLTDKEAAMGSQEITFAQFRKYLLETHQIEKLILIPNQNICRVYLKEGSTGVPMNGATPSSTFSNSNTSNNINEWNTTMMDMGSNNAQDEFTTSNDSNNTNSKFSNNPLTKTKPQRPPSYHLTFASIESFEKKLEDTQQSMGVAPRDFIPVSYRDDPTLFEVLKAGMPLAMVAFIYFLLSRGAAGAGGAGPGGPLNQIFKINKSSANAIEKQKVNVKFTDVAGCDQAKKEIMEFVEFLKDPKIFTKLGAKIPKGALLTGPPGTGKTLLAKATAGESNVPFYSISGSEFIEMFVGVGPARVRDLFQKARENAPCIIFIDEIDAVGRKRGKGNFSGGNDERENTLNQLLVEMDGFNSTTNIVVLAGTNRADILDDALTRPGRFDRQIVVDKPDLKGRKEIFEVHLKGITLAGDAADYSSKLAALTPGFAGADIANICNEAAIQAARRKGDAVEMIDFEKATDRVIGGLESNKIITPAELNIVAHHEAGHAVAGWFLEHADPLLKVTIVPRSSGALGYAQYLPKEIALRTNDQIMDIVCMALAGRAAEDVFFGKVTTGASDDLRKVTAMVYQTIQLYGMNDRIGQLAFPKDESGFGDKPYSDATAQAMDEEAKQIVDAAYKRTVELIREKKDEVGKVAKLLLEKETIDHDDIIDLIGHRPFEGDNAYKEYVSVREERMKRNQRQEEEAKKEEESSEEVGGNGLAPGLV